MKPLPVSYSTLSGFENCPRQYFELKVAKSVQDNHNDVGEAGLYLHAAFEAYLKDRTPLPDTYPTNVAVWPVGLKTAAGYKDYLDAILRLPGVLHVEHKMAIDADFTPCDFAAEGVFCRGIADVLLVDGDDALLMDHKAGKQRVTKQLQLSSLLVFYHFPEVQRVRTQFNWLNGMKASPGEFTRSDMAVMWEDFIPMLVRFKTAFKAGAFVPKPSGLCNGWCPVTTCDFWKPKRTR